jgi:uncharacterized FAD-dependent dehydrogenase
MVRLEAAEMRFQRSVKGYTRLDKIRSEVIKKITKDFWNTRREIQIQTKLDQPSRKNGQQQTSETCPQLQTSREREEIVDAPGKDGNGSMPEQVKRLNSWSKMVMMMMIIYIIQTQLG